MPLCILCKHPHTEIILEKKPYTYLECSNCGLIFVDPAQRMPPGEEKKRYDQHENNPDDPGYRNFLKQLFDPLNELLPAAQSGLDYGSGPGPTLHLMFEEAGHSMNIYDPFYAKDETVLNREYNFITVTETAEHFFDPAREFEKLCEMIKPGGYLGVMTLLFKDGTDFSDWFYIKDDTHVTFYRKRTFEWLAEKLGAEVTFYGDRVIILQKKWN